MKKKLAPIVGGTIEIVNAPGYKGRNIYPHNIVLEILMATGFVGFLLFILFLVPILKKIRYLINKIDINFAWVSIVLIQGVSQNLVSGSIYMASIIFFALGIINTGKNKYSK